MKTYIDMQNAMQEDRNRFAIHKQQLCGCLSSLETCYNRCMDSGMTPEATAAEWCSRNSVSLCTEVLCSMINRIPFDGRIDSSLFAWAASESSAWDRECANHLSLFCPFHSAHLNQIAHAFRRLYIR